MKKIDNASTTILVEILGIATIVAILFLTFLPKASKISMNAKKNNFTQSLKEIEKNALNNWESTKSNKINNRTVYRIVDGLDCISNKQENEKLDYEIVLDDEGKIIRFRATDGSYQYDSGEVDELKFIRNIQAVSTVDENERVKIICNNNAYLTEEEKKEQKKMCVINSNLDFNKEEYDYYEGELLKDVVSNNNLGSLNTFYSNEYIACVEGIVEDYDNEVNNCLYMYHNTSMDNSINYDGLVNSNEEGCYSKYIASIEPSTVNYIVNHYKQRLGVTKTDKTDSNYELADSEVFSTTIGESVNPKTNNYIGFVAPKTSNVKVEDNKTIINYYYDREYYKVRLTSTDGVINLHGNGTYQYGESVTISADISDDSTWQGWYKENDLQTSTNKYNFIIDSDVKLTAKTIKK